MELPPRTGEQVVEAARAYLGTPYHHDARLKGVGVDCSGLVIGAMNDLGVPVEDVRGYGRDGDGFAEMERRVRVFARKVRTPRAGDILLFRARMMLNHCGFCTGETPGGVGLIHAYSAPSVGAVVEHPMDDSWERRLVGVYRYKGIAPKEGA